ncbi:pectin acetylesterase 5-like isoform X1 [Coffea arabica]|uniref:Pectin acetylesterase n=2 Tax=Coffea arabica TaxID=13443 RepID=A0ABM4ULF3_COFAR|nr:pectin acetylesterase 5-like isoform X1 [Coffea arabica]
MANQNQQRSLHLPHLAGPRGLGSGWSKRELIFLAAVVIVTILIFSHSSPKYSSTIVGNHTDKSSNSAPPSSASRHSDWIPFTPLTNAHHKAALCLDGSVPGYHMEKGFGSGSHDWVLHIEGGGWCNTIASCSSRKKTALGSSKYMDAPVQFSGILSHDPLQNPDFYNWNKVKIRYCDGASFSGHPDAESKNGPELFFRGQLIWEAVMDQLLSLGLSNARQALLSGCSAGGLATLLHCDNFQGILPKGATVKCLADAGFFLNEKDVAGNHTIESFYRDVVNLQGIAKSLNKDCLSKMEPHKCFFPQEFIENIKTPLFLVHPAYDFWQIRNILAPDESDSQRTWLSCKLNIFNCNPSQLEVLRGFRNSLLKTLGKFQQNKEGGMFINSCFIHCQTWMAETWHSPTSPRINNRTIAECVGDWYFNRKEAKEVDRPFPCNPTCYNMDFTRGL